MTDYEVVIGLEVHVQLKTRTKMFCRCPAEFGRPPNSLTCPVCLGLPGSLPVPNREAFRMAVRTGLALGGTIAPFTKFDRKNYYYPDLPKNYQISQYDLPFCDGGAVRIDAEGGERDVGLTRIHLEEDAGKNTHGEGASLVDLNRAGTPLLEIVSRPDLPSADEAHAFLTELKAILLYLDVSDCNMEEGSLRCDANVSVRPRGQPALGTKVEVKNMNSFKAVRAALVFEADRQAGVLERGERVVQETRLWDEDRGKTASMRSKEEAEDYRYFPDPDLPPLRTTPEELEALRAELPELPRARRERYVRSLGLSAYDAGVLAGDKAISEYFEAVAAATPDAKGAANWVTNRVLAHLNDRKIPISRFPVPPAHLAQLIELLREKKISSKIAGDVFPKMIETGEAPARLVEAAGGGTIRDEAAIRTACRKVASESPGLVADYRAGKTKVLGALVGRVMKETKGKADPEMTNRILQEILES